MNRFLHSPTAKRLEPLFVFLFFLVHAGNMVPGVNEEHYLAKARHYWDPTWCANDQFMNSADAHLAFYWAFGWLTTWSLPLAAWVGRFVGWGALAYAWTKLSRAVCQVPGTALLSAALAINLIELTNMAGEWLVGGIEGKVIAWALVLLAVRYVVSDQWIPVWPLLGAAIAFHALVGGWAWIICMGVLAMQVREVAQEQGAGIRREWLHRIAQLAPSMLVGLAAASIGIVPALAMDWQVDSDVAIAAHLIQVNERLGHHLRLSGMPWYRIARFVGLVAVWLLISAGPHLSPQLVRLRRVVNGSLLISLSGALIGLLGVLYPAAAASLLRFYWFRMSDVLVPTGLTLLVVSQVASWPTVSPRAKQRALAIALVGLICWVPLRFFYLKQDRRPHAVRQARPYRAEQREQLAARYADWREACAWIQQFTPTDATFLTPPRQQTFKWFADRGEFATWKGMPQNAEAIVAWKRRRRQLDALGLFDPLRGADAEAVQALAQRYGLTHLLMEKGYGRLKGHLPLIYRNDHFDVYRLSPQGDRDPEGDPN